MMKFQEKYAGPKEQKRGNKKLVSKTDARCHSSLCLLNWRGRNVPLCQGCSAQRAAYEGGEGGIKNIPYVLVVHRLWQDLLAKFLERTADSKETKKFPSALGCPPVFLWICMWKLCMLIGKLWRFRWNCWINSQWKEAKRIRSGESFRSSQVRVKHMSWHPLQIYKRTCTKGK